MVLYKKWGFNTYYFIELVKYTLKCSCKVVLQLLVNFNNKEAIMSITSELNKLDLVNIENSKVSAEVVDNSERLSWSF